MAIRSRLSDTAPASVTHVVPLPANRQNGDRVVVGFVNNNATTTATPSTGWVTDPAWTLGQGTSTNHRLTVVTRVLDGSANDALTMTMVDGGHGNVVEAAWDVICMQGAGALPTAQVQLASGGGNTGATGTATVTAITGLASGDYDSLIFLGIDNSDGEQHALTAIPSGWGNVTPPAPQAATLPVLAHSMDRSAAGVTGFSPGPITFDLQEQWLTAHVVIAAVPAPPAQTINPTTVPAPPAPPQPQVKVGFTIAPTPVPAPAPPPAPTVVPGPVNVFPTPVPSPPAPPAPKLAQVIRPATVPSAAAVYEPTIERRPRPPLRVDFWALADDRSILCPLPQPVGWDLSLIPGEDGAVRLEYPVDGLNFDVLDQRINRSRDLFVHIRTDGTAKNALGALLTARQGDEVSEDGTVTFTGTFLTALLREGWLPYNDADEKGETHFSAATAGAILGWILAATQAEGFCTDLHWSFTDTHDSRGTPWPANQRMSPTFSPGETPHSIAQELRSWGVAEFEVTTDLEVRLYVPDTVGVDHTLKDPPIVLRAGRDLVEAPRRTDVSDAATDLLVIGKDGVHVKLHDDTARARRGRRVGQVVSQGNLADTASATAYGTVELGRRIWGVDELTHELTFDPDHPTPLRELNPLDWVYSDRGRGFTGPPDRERISQLTISMRDDDYSGGVVLRDLIEERDVSLQQQIDRLKNGATVIGTSAPDNPDDGKPPAAPTGLVIGSDVAYQVPGDPLTYAEVTAQWQAVTTNADGTPATDISGYRVRWAYLGFDQVGGLPSSNPDGEPLAWYEPEGSPTTGLQLMWGTAEAGREIGVQVAAIDRSGLQSEWSTRVDITTQVDNTAPPAPSAPALSVWFRTIDAHYDGLGSAGEAMPDDTDVIEVWFSQTAAFSVPATVSDPVEFDPALTTPQHVANLQPIGGTWNQPNIPVGVGWYVAFRAIDRSGLASPLSPIAGPVTAQQLVQIDIGPNAIGHQQIIDLEVVRAKIADLAVNDAKIETLSVGKLITGTLQATVVLGSQIRTAPVGATTSRGEFDAAGLRLYNSSNQLTVNLNASTGTALITGTIQSALAGERWVMMPDGTLRLYPAAGNNYSQISNEGNDVVWRGPLDSNQRSGRVNVNMLGVGINFSREANLLENIRAELLVLDRQTRMTAPFMNFQVDERWSSPVGGVNSGRRIQFSTIDSSGNFITRSGMSYITDSNGNGGMVGNDTGFKFENFSGLGGRFAVTNGNMTDWGVGRALDWEKTSSETAKEEIEDVRAILDPVEVIRNARARKFKFNTGNPDEPVSVGVIAEELPEVLHRVARLPSGEESIGLSISSEMGVMWGALNQIFEQEIVSTSGTVVLDPGAFFPRGIFPPGATVEAPVTWESTPPAAPTGGFVQMHSSFIWAGKVAAWLKTGSVTATGAIVVFKNISNSNVVVGTSDTTRVSATAIGLGLYTPPYVPPEE